MPHDKGIGDIIHAGCVDLVPGDTFDVAGMAMRLRYRPEERLTSGDLRDGTARQVHARIGMATVEGKARAAKVLQPLEPRVGTYDENPAMGRALAVGVAIDGRGQQRGLSAVDRLQRIAAYLREEGVGFDLGWNWATREIEVVGKIAQAKTRQLDPHCGPERAVVRLHLRQIVHWQADPAERDSIATYPNHVWPRIP